MRHTRFDMRSILIKNGLMQVIFKRPFAQFVKKAYKPLQLAIEDAVELICASPKVGEGKVGDLAGIRVYKFRFSRQEYLVAYRPPVQDLPSKFLTIDFYQVGLHENFYAELKQYLRQESRKGAAK